MKKIKDICILLTAVWAIVSCATTDTETTLYSEAAITAFTLGNLNQYTQTTNSEGVTSTTKKTYSGSSYKFIIDQHNRQIYNNDSLPVGTDAKHVLCTITTAKNSVALFQDLTDADAYYYYTSADSIDFSQDRKVRVLSSDGTGRTDYTIKVNVHKQQANEFVWQPADGEFPEEPTLPQGIKQLLGSSTTEQYAISDNGKLMVSFDNGATWTQDMADDNEPAMQPTKDISLVSYPLFLADSTDYVLIAGTHVEKAADGSDAESYSVVWRKTVDYSQNAPASTWVYMDRNGNSNFDLPVLDKLNLVKYDDSILAFGGDYSTIYQSRDNGITWKKSSVYKMPAEFDQNATSVKVKVDEDNFIWLYCYGTGQIWKGRLNKLGWVFQ